MLFSKIVLYKYLVLLLLLARVGAAMVGKVTHVGGASKLVEGACCLGVWLPTPCCCRCFSLLPVVVGVSP